jgi:regulatory protein YycH of two-component signal transduction system YycFG
MVKMGVVSVMEVMVVIMKITFTWCFQPDIARIHTVQEIL